MTGVTRGARPRRNLRLRAGLAAALASIDTTSPQFLAAQKTRSGGS